MATSGSITVGVTSIHAYVFSWTLKSQSVENNTSTIEWWVRYENTELLGRYDLSDGIYETATVTINGNVYEFGCTSVGALHGTETIQHNSDGNKTFSFSFSRRAYADNVYVDGEWQGIAELVTGNGTGVLPKITRSASLSASNGTLGVKQYINISRDASKLLCTITYKCGSASGTIATKTAESSVTFTPPLSLASQNVEGESVQITLTVTAYDGSTNIGSSKTTITCAIPDSVAPTLSMAVADYMGYASTFGKYVQGCSKLSIELTAAGAYGSTIKSYKITADGRTYTKASVITDSLKGSGSLEIISTITDSRGRTATAKTTISVYAYTAPTVTALSVERTNSYLAVTFSAEITPLDNKNTAAYSVRYKKIAETAYTEVNLSDYSGQYSVADAVYTFPADPEFSYDVEIVAADAFGTVRRVSGGSSLKKLFSIITEGLQGFALGKYAELEGVFDVGFVTRFSGGIMHPTLDDNISLDDIMTPNTYIGNNAITAGYYHCPHDTDDPFTLEVLPAGTEGHLIQRVTVCNYLSMAVYTRAYCFETWGAWQTVYSQ